MNGVTEKLGEGSAVFRLLQSTRILRETTLPESIVRWEMIAVDERHRYSFELESPEQDTEYSVRIGDMDPEAAPETQSPRSDIAVGVPHARFVTWDEACHFEGARGRVWLRVASRVRPEAGASARRRGNETTPAVPWKTRALLPVYVVTGKLSEQRYDTMYEELRRLAAGLLFDLISKSSRALTFGVSQVSVSPASSQIELRTIEQLWQPLARALQEIGESPALRLGTVNEYRPTWGGERLGAESLARLAAVGIDPRSRSEPRPFHAWRERYCEDSRTTEHAVIRGFLQMLQGRVGDCLRNVVKHMMAIEHDRPLRQVVNAGAGSLFDTQDMPRLGQLREAERRGRAVQRQLAQAVQLSFLQGVTPRYKFEETPTFRYVQPYYQFSQLMRQYLRSSMVVLDDGDDERLKSTSRVYEQWVFLQLAAALRGAGLTCVSREGLLQQTRRYRYTLDIDRGARLTFLASDGTAAVLRYEPWILPRDLARQRHETVYREGRGAAWSPDMLIEFIMPSEHGGAGDEVSYAVVLDAKYSTGIRDHHWESTSKYQNIRATRSDRQVARQLWLICPAEEDADTGHGINFEDTAVTWTQTGPDCGRDEFMRGWISLVPREHPSDFSAEPGWIAEPAEVLVEFVTGLLRFLEIRP